MKWMYVCPNAMRRSARSLVLSLCAALAAVSLSASSPQSAPPQPSSGTVVNVSSEAQLQRALAELASDTTIVIAPGTYTLSRTLTIDGALTNVAIRGGSENKGDVVLAGKGAGNADFGEVPHGISVSGGVQGVTIANLTIRDVYNHAIVLAAGTGSPRIQNVHLVDAGQSFIKAAAEGGPAVDSGILEASVLEATSPSRDANASGIAIEGGSRWTIKGNVFRNLHAPDGQLASPAVFVRGGGETVVEGNTFVHTQREIGLGAADGAPHSGGIVRNNFITRSAGSAGGSAIAVFGTGAQVLHNSILANGSSSVAIEVGSTDAAGVVVRNNLTDSEVQAQSEAGADIADNFTTATPALFANAASGDLHLVASATAVMDRVGVMSGAPSDWDGEPRPQGGSADYGADEYAAAGQQPGTQTTGAQAPAPSTTTATGTGATATGTGATATGTLSSPTNATTATTATDPAEGEATASAASVTAASTLPAPWVSADVGNAVPAGSATHASGTFTVEGGGASIGGSADQFRFVYQTLNGDGDIVARVADLERTHPWAKAGVMFRDELTDSARHAFAFVAAGQGPGFEYRQSDGASSTQTSTGSRAIPAFLKVSRRGNTFTAYTSGDGSTWSEMGSQSISMNSLVYVGLAVSSRSTRELATGTFDQVTVTPVDSGTDPDPEPDPDPTNQPPTVTLTSPANGATFTAPATVQLAATAADADGSVSQVDFYVNGTLVASDTSSPYAASWNASAAGTFTLTANARDNAGAWTSSAPVSITVAAATVELPRYVVFNASTDHDTNVTSYTVEFFTAGSDPSKATPVRTQNLGKPTPVSGEIKVDVAATIQALPSGTYISTVVATGSGGSTRSAPSSSFVR